MKTLGELRVGDGFYLIYYSGEGNCILSVRKHVVSVITEVKIGEIIKWTDQNGYVRGTSITKEDYGKYICKAFYECKLCSDKDFVLDFIENDKNRQMDKYNKILKELSN